MTSSQSTSHSPIASEPFASFCALRSFMVPCLARGAGAASDAVDDFAGVSIPPPTSLSASPSPALFSGRVAKPAGVCSASPPLGEPAIRRVFGTIAPPPTPGKSKALTCAACLRGGEASTAAAAAALRSSRRTFTGDGSAGVSGLPVTTAPPRTFSAFVSFRMSSRSSKSILRVSYSPLARESKSPLSFAVASTASWTPLRKLSVSRSAISSGSNPAASSDSAPPRDSMNTSRAVGEWLRSSSVSGGTSLASCLARMAGGRRGTAWSMTTTVLFPPLLAPSSPSPVSARPYNMFPGFPRHISREQGSRSGLARSMSSTNTRPSALAFSPWLSSLESAASARRRSSGTKGLPRTYRITSPAWLSSRQRANASAASASSRTSSDTVGHAASSDSSAAAETTGNESRLAASSAAVHSRPSAGGTGAPGNSPAGGVFSAPPLTTPGAALRNRRVVGATTPSDLAISNAKYSDCAASLLAQNLTTATVSRSVDSSVSAVSAPSKIQKKTAPPELMSTAPPPMFVSSASFSSATDSDRTTALSFVQSSGRSTRAGVHRRSLDLSLPANGDGPHVPLSVERKEDQFDRNDAVLSSGFSSGGVPGGDDGFEAASPEREPSSDMRCGAASMNTVAISSTAPASCLHLRGATLARPTPRSISVPPCPGTG
mmetsp:Transcript_12370/g.57207  ORF Transcript_12370/g.57207 Transcript_12370/m.57207 type:complete len:660 (-) Transcript_12370:169-2148(-)